MKKVLFFATALIALASCTNNDFVGDAPTPTSQDTQGAIVFGSGLNTPTRANHVGADAANLLNNKFIVSGFKGAGPVTATTTATGTVFDNYVVNWTANTAATTESNTSDWEYVGITAVAPSKLAGNAQSIKYWDYSADQYDFIAYSTGTATAITTGTPTDGQVLVSAINPATATTAAYTIQGATADLKNCYIADMVTAYKDGADATNKYQSEVQLVFRSLVSKVRVALYETIPGYSIKDVKFYSDATTTLATGATETSATLFTSGTETKDNFYKNGTFTVKFPTIGKTNYTTGNSDYNKAHVSFAVNGEGKGTTMAFGNLNLVGRDYREVEATNYIGRTSATASFAGVAGDNYYTVVLPNEEGTVLELRVDYTLLSIDGSGEEIKVHGATAFVPAIYATWKPGYAYTYIFKISDNTNGWTSTAGGAVGTDPAGLYPITFDAVVLETTDREQSTITTVATPSITTYQKGHNYADDEYIASKGDIYVQVMDGETLKEDLDTKGQLYTLSTRTGKPWTEAEVMDALNIQDASDANTVTGRNGLVLTKATSDATITTIPGADGNNITVTAKTAAKFTPSAGTYAYVYSVSNGTPSEYNTAVVFNAAPTDWATAYSNYYTDENCTTTAPATFPTLGTGETVTYYQKYTNQNNVYGVKVIKVL